MESELIDQTVVRFPRYAASEIAVHPLEKGGSDRRFYRMSVGGEASLILAKYGTQREENRHYVTIARFLHGLGVRVPEMYYHDEQEGLIWMEDLGDRDLWSYRAEPWSERRERYRSALDELVLLHTRGHRAPEHEVPRLETEFNRELYLWEQGYFLENCLTRYFGVTAGEIEEHACRARLGEIAARLHELPRVFVHRDFQSQNIVMKDDSACLIDFQGMRPGLRQYDLASVLYDPYVEFTPEERAELLGYYLDEAGDTGPAREFMEVYHLCAMQRLMQALGAYGFLGLVKERPHFLAHIPAAMANLREVLARIEGLDGLSGLLARHVPPVVSL